MAVHARRFNWQNPEPLQRWRDAALKRRTIRTEIMYTVPKLDDYSPEALDRAVADLFAALDAETAALQSESDWKTFRDRWMARKNGVLTQINDTWLKAAPGPAKREVGQRVNELKSRAEAAIEAAHDKLHASSTDAKLVA